ncbi:MAG: hypothetical protein M1820_008671 [Bogoriella megaspora]|nr:MAG: hypothetical protein M1820_008671 [Bogoriella megaspora]
MDQGHPSRVPGTTQQYIQQYNQQHTPQNAQQHNTNVHPDSRPPLNRKPVSGPVVGSPQAPMQEHRRSSAVPVMQQIPPLQGPQQQPQWEGTHDPPLSSLAAGHPANAPRRPSGPIGKVASKAIHLAKPAALIAGAVSLEAVGLNNGVDVLGGVSTIGRAYNKHKARQAQRMSIENGASTAQQAGFGNQTVQDMIPQPDGAVLPAGLLVTQGSFPSCTIDQAQNPFASLGAHGTTFIAQTPHVFRPGQTSCRPPPQPASQRAIPHIAQRSPLPSIPQYQEASNLQPSFNYVAQQQLTDALRPQTYQYQQQDPRRGTSPMAHPSPPPRISSDGDIVPQLPQRTPATSPSLKNERMLSESQSLLGTRLTTESSKELPANDARLAQPLPSLGHSSHHSGQTVSPAALTYPEHILQVARTLYLLLEEFYKSDPSVQTHHPYQQHQQQASGTAIMGTLKKLLNGHHDKQHPSPPVQNSQRSSHYVQNPSQQSHYCQNDTYFSQQQNFYQAQDPSQQSLGSQNSVSPDQHENRYYMQDTAQQPFSSQTYYSSQQPDVLPSDNLYIQSSSSSSVADVLTNSLANVNLGTQSPALLSSTDTVPSAVTASDSPLSPDNSTTVDPINSNQVTVAEDNDEIIDLSSLGGVGYCGYDDINDNFVPDAKVFTDAQPPADIQSMCGPGLGGIVYESQSEIDTIDPSAPQATSILTTSDISTTDGSPIASDNYNSQNIANTTISTSQDTVIPDTGNTIVSDTQYQSITSTGEFGTDSMDVLSSTSYASIPDVSSGGLDASSLRGNNTQAGQSTTNSILGFFGMGPNATTGVESASASSTSGFLSSLLGGQSGNDMLAGSLDPYSDIETQDMIVSSDGLI